MADLDPARPQALVDRLDDSHFAAAQVDASDQASVAALAREHDAILNATDPRFNLPIFEAAFEVPLREYLDMAMSLSSPEALLGGSSTSTSAGRTRGCSRSSGSASSPASRTSSRATRPTICSPRSTRSVCATGRTSRSRATNSRQPLDLDDDRRVPLNPPLVWERERGWYTTEPFGG